MTAPRCEQLSDDVTVWLGDAREIAPTLTGIDAVISDPPYGISHSSNHGASWAGTQIASDQDTSARDTIAATFAGLPAAYFGTWKTPPVQGARGCIVWDKGPAFGMGDLSFPWKPSFELAYICGEGWEGHRDNGVLRGPVVVSWEKHPNVEDSMRRMHPHQKPVWLCAHFIEKLPNARTILDPFLGSGSTGVAAVQLGRRFVGIEIDPKHFATACRRISDELSRPRLPLDTPAPKPVQESWI